MTQPTRRLITLASGLAVFTAALCMLSACSEPPPPPEPEPEFTPPPPPPPPPAPVEIDNLKLDLNIDDRVFFSQDLAPIDEGLAEAVLTLANTFATGDDAQLDSLLASDADRAALTALLDSGAWYDETDAVEEVRVVAIDDDARLFEDPEFATVALAVQLPGDTQILLWEGESLFGDWSFVAAPATPESRPLASSWDGITIDELLSAAPGEETLTAESFVQQLRECLSDALIASLTSLGLNIDDFDPETQLEELESTIDSLGSAIDESTVKCIRDLIDLYRSSGGGGDSGGGDDPGNGGGSGGSG
ncbi:MAG: hypothetical protein AAF747_10345, partial [Planctomycetota bacterium]